jgi:DNA-binding CsgD family transcriptional regulator/tetratricopeptide (TPR) repeat protein
MPSLRASYTAAVLVGRDEERRRIDSLIAAAREGRGQVLVLLGEAGIGKSALLRYAESQAAGFTMLRASGTESESELAFAGLADLLRPLLGELDVLPAPQAVALGSALALGPSVPGDRFAVGTATLGLLSRAAEAAPVAALVEDAHWLDQPSLAALLFVARRLQAEDVLMIFSAREEEGPAATFDGLGTLCVRGLDTPAASRLLALAAEPMSASVAARVRAAASGNPLALLEMPTMLTDAQRSGTEAIDEPLAVGPGLARAYQRHVATLSDEAQAGLLVAAVSDRDDLEPVTRAMRRMGLGQPALEEAEDAGFVALGAGRLIWRHPLVRAAVHHGASPSARRSAHRALAEALEGQGEADRQAWHLAAAALGNDEAAAQALERSGVSARLRRGSAAAARAFERAASLSVEPEDRARRLHEAALDLLSTAEPGRAGQLLAEALGLTKDALRRADIQRARALADLFRGPAEVNIETLTTEADLVEPLDPERATLMRGDACVACTMTGNVRKTLDLAARTLETARRVGPQAIALSECMLANGLILAGKTGDARSHLVAARDVFKRDGLPPAPFLVQLIQALGHSAMWLEEYDEARRFLNEVVRSARDQSAAGGLAFPLSCLSEIEYRTGRWTDAYALATESERIATEAGERNELSFSLVCLARIEAASGRENECRAHVLQALDISRELGSGSIEVYARATLGLLELGLGHPDRAVLHLESLARLVERFQLADPNVVQWASDFVEALVRAGYTAAAQAALLTFERQALATEHRWALGESARCRGLLADDAHFEECFAEALHWFGGDAAVFERDRTLLCLGERRRRARHIGQAREALVAALAGFEQLGAQPWIKRTRRELRAAGARLGPLTEQPIQRLTPQELQVALAVTAGATNREAAASLFLSPKTVDFHLGKVYRKLDVRSRSELAAFMTRQEDVSSAG